MLGSVIKSAVLATLLTALITPLSPPVITKAFAGAGGGSAGVGNAAAGGGAGGYGWEDRSPATPVLHRFHEARRTNDSLKQQAVRKTLPDHVQSVGVRTSLDTHPRGNDDATTVKQLVNRSPDEVQAAPLVERKAEQTLGTAPVHAPADAVQIALPSVIEACRGHLEAWPCTAVLPDRHNDFPE